MQLKIQRSQRQAGISGKVIFCLDARIFLSAQEQANVSRYRLGGEVIYNSQAARKHLDRADEQGRQGSYFKSIASVALAAMNLNITAGSLQRGQHIECKDLNELLAAEDALMTACDNLKQFLETAATFDGREVVIDFSQPEPVAVSKPVPLPPPLDPAPVIAAFPAPDPLPPTSAPAIPGDSATVYMEREPDSFAAVRNWWLNLAPNMRLVLMAVAGIVVLILLFKL